MLVLCEVMRHQKRSGYRAAGSTRRDGVQMNGDSDGSSSAHFLRVMVCDSGKASKDLDPVARREKEERQ